VEVSTDIGKCEFCDQPAVMQMRVDPFGKSDSMVGRCSAHSNNYVVLTTTSAPIPMILYCPACGRQHIDAPELAIGWTNPDHRSHRCSGCGTIFRPADVCTTGVESISTKGQHDTWDVKECNNATMAMREPYVEWDEPYGESSDGVVPSRNCRTSLPDAIRVQKQDAWRAKEYTYTHDHDALQDFVANHWGRIVR
jgi:hypothetical protein